jgi:hypothetical protein
MGQAALFGKTLKSHSCKLFPAPKEWISFDGIGSSFPPFKRFLRTNALIIDELEEVV